MTPSREVGVAQRGLGAASLIVAAGLLLVAEPWHGSVLLVFSSNQGLDLGDLPVVGLLIVAAILVENLSVVAGAAGRLRRGRQTRWGDRRLAAMGTGTALLAVGTSELCDGGSRHARVVEAGIALAVLASLGWLVAAMGRSVTGPAVAFLGGVLLDALLQPSGTLFGPILVAAYLAATARRRSAAVALSITIVLFAAASIASLADIAGLDVRMADGGGGPVRTAALGLVLIVGGAFRAMPATATPAPP